MVFGKNKHSKYFLYSLVFQTYRNVPSLAVATLRCALRAARLRTERHLDCRTGL